jgi:hypothetical protein
MVNDRELLGSSELTAYLSGLRQPGPLGRLKMNIYLLTRKLQKILQIYVYLRSDSEIDAYAL